MVGVSKTHTALLGQEGAVISNRLHIRATYRLLRRNGGWPRKLKPWPKQTIHTPAVAFPRKPRTRELPHIKQRSEKSREEHHLGKNKPKHAQHVAVVQLSAIHTLHVFSNSGAEPARQRENKKHQTSRQNPLGVTRFMGLTKGHIIEEQASSKDRQDQTYRRTNS